MKKIIAGTLIGYVLLTSSIFAAGDLKPMLINIPIELISEKPVKDIIKSNEIIIRNNILESDYKYNSTHYYTTKITGNSIVIPKDIQEKVKKIYFLIEEGQNSFYYTEDAMLKGASSIEEIKNEYNYKIVDFKIGQKKYIFDNNDLVKEFWDDKYKNVTITLMAEFSETEKIPLSNKVYISISTKKSVLEQLLNENNQNYYGYYNTNDLEIYLESLSEKMKRSDYKKMLVKADRKINLAQKKNESNLKDILKSIKNDSGFVKNINKYKTYSETRNLLRNLGSAVEKQIQNIKAFDAIDAILR